MKRVIQKGNSWVVQKKVLFIWKDVKSFESKLKAEKYGK